MRSWSVVREKLPCKSKPSLFLSYIKLRHETTLQDAHRAILHESILDGTALRDVDGAGNRRAGSCGAAHPASVLEDRHGGEEYECAVPE